MTHIIGIDPGLSGAIAILSPTGELERLADLLLAQWALNRVKVKAA